MLIKMPSKKKRNQSSDSESRSSVQDCRRGSNRINPCNPCQEQRLPVMRKFYSSSSSSSSSCNSESECNPSELCKSRQMNSCPSKCDWRTGSDMNDTGIEITGTIGDKNVKIIKKKKSGYINNISCSSNGCGQSKSGCESSSSCRCNTNCFTKKKNKKNRKSEKCKSLCGDSSCSESSESCSSSSSSSCSSSSSSDSCCGSNNKSKKFKVGLGASSESPNADRITTNNSFYVDGKAGRVLYLKRNRTYLFNVNTGTDNENHQFFFTTDLVGGKLPNGSQTVQIPGTPNTTSKGVMKLKITKNFPSIFYYQDMNNSFCGGLCIVR
jgi:hypothetical protein